jgi:hypothetical protein
MICRFDRVVLDKEILRADLIEKKNSIATSPVFPSQRMHCCAIAFDATNNTRQ